jgi:hypothetical protein
LKESGCGLVEVLSHICPDGLRKTVKNSLRLAGVVAKIQIERYLNTKPENIFHYN